MEDIIPGVRVHLDKKLLSLTRIIAAVVKDPGAPSPTTADQLDLELQQVLKDSAERLAQYQRDIDYKKQKFDFQEVLQAAKAEHEAERSVLEERLSQSHSEAEQLRRRVAKLESAQAALLQRVQQAESTLSSCQEELDEQVEHLQQQVQVLQSREQHQVMAAQEQSRRHAAEVNRLQELLEGERSSAQLRQSEYFDAEAAWQRERQEMQERHACQMQEYMGQLDKVKADAAVTAAALVDAHQKAVAADVHAAHTVQQAEQLAADLGAATQRQQQLERELQEARDTATQQQQQLNHELKQARQAARQQERQLEQLEQECTALKEQAAVLSGQLQQGEQQLQAVRGALTATEAQHSSERVGWEQQAARDKAILQEQEGKLATLQGHLQRAQQEVQHLQSALAAFQAHEQQLIAENGRMQGELASLQQTLATEQEAAATQRAALEAAREALTQAASELEEVRERLGLELAAARMAHAEEMQQRGEENRTKLADAELQMSRQLLQQEQHAAFTLAQLTADYKQQLAALHDRHTHQLQSQLVSFDQHCSGLSGAMQCMLELLAAAPGVQLTAGEAPSPLYIPPLGDELQGAAGEHGSAHDSSGGGNASCPSSPKSSLPLSLQVAHTVLQELYSAALGMRAQRHALLQQVADLQAAAERAAQQLGREQVQWEWRFGEQARDLDREWGLKLREAVAAAEATGRQKLAQTEDALRSELRQIMQALGTAQAECSRLLQHCAECEEECTELRRQHTAELASTKAQAESDLAGLRAQHAEHLDQALAAAGQEKARREALLRDEMKRTLQAQAEQHSRALTDLNSKHDAAMAEAASKAAQQRQQDEQVLAAATETWEERLASLSKQQAEELARLEASQEQVVTALKQQHAEKVGRMQGRISLLEKSERQLLTAKAGLEAQLAELRASLIQLQDRVQLLTVEYQADLARARVQLEQSVQAVQAEMQCQVSSLVAEKATLAEQAQEFQTMIGRDPRPQDLQQIALLEQSLADLQSQLAALEARYQRMRQEMLLREDNYNRTFANGGAGLQSMGVERALGAPQAMVDWMLRKGPGANARVTVDAVGVKAGSLRGASPTSLLPNLKGPNRR